MTALPEVTITIGRPRLEATLARVGAPAAAVMAILTAAWVGVLISAPAPPAGAAADERLRFVAEHDGWQALSFAFTFPLPFLHVPLWFALAALFWQARPAASLLTVSFGLLYAPFTAWGYWTQMTVVRGLAQLRNTAPADALAAYQTLGFQGTLWSTPYATVVLGYAIWGLAGLAVAAGLLPSAGRLARVTGGLFGLSGVLALVGGLGFVIRDGLLETGVMASGVVFLFAAIAATVLLARVGWHRPAHIRK